jgi:hypothetical protein
LYSSILQNLYSLANTEVPYYSGQTYVSPSALTQQGVATGQNAANQYIGAGQTAQMAANPYLASANAFGQAAGAQNRIAGMANQNYGFLSNAADVANNPYVQNQLGANKQQVTQALNEQWLPTVNQGAQEVNALGSSRQGVAQGQAMERAAQQLANANASTMLSAYGQGLGAQQTALGQTGALQQAQAAGAQSLGQAGQAVQQAAGAQATGAGYTNQASGLQSQLGQTVEGYQQKALDEAIDRYNYQYEEPWTRMSNVSNYLTGLFGDTGISYTSSTGTGTTTGTSETDTSK